jgi:hypothetical protein
MSAKKTATTGPTMDELLKRWEKEQPKWANGVVKNARRWCFQERKRLEKVTREKKARHGGQHERECAHPTGRREHTGWSCQ